MSILPMLYAFDEIQIELSLKEINYNRVKMAFDYKKRLKNGETRLVAQGEQEIACMTRNGEKL